MVQGLPNLPPHRKLPPWKAEVHLQAARLAEGQGSPRQDVPERPTQEGAVAGVALCLPRLQSALLRGESPDSARHPGAVRRDWAGTERGAARGPKGPDEACLLFSSLETLGLTIQPSRATAGANTEKGY